MPLGSGFRLGEAPTEVIDLATAQTRRLSPVAEGSSAREHGRVAGLGDGLALALSNALNSVAGLVGWLLAAKLMSTAEVGRAQQVVTAFMLIGGAAQLNLGAGLLRWIPTAGRHTSRLIWTSLLLIMPLSGLVGLVYALAVPEIGETSAGAAPFVFGLVLFVLACAGWGVFVVHDFILVALHRPWWALWRNILFSATRLALLLGLVLAGLGAQGVVLSWAVPIVLLTVVGSLVIAVLAHRFGRSSSDGRLPSLAAAVRFLAPTAVAQLAGTMLYNQVALLVTTRVGYTEGAKFFIAWQAVTVVEVSAMFFMNSLAVNYAREPHRGAELAAAARRRLLVIFLPVLALGALLAEPALMIFGPEYAEATTVLRLIMLGLAFRLIVAHELGVRQAEGRGVAYARLQLISSVLVVFVAGFAPVDGASEPLLVVALGYVAVQVICAAAVLVTSALRRTRPEVRS